MRKIISQQESEVSVESKIIYVKVQIGLEMKNSKVQFYSKLARIELINILNSQRKVY